MNKIILTLAFLFIGSSAHAVGTTEPCGEGGWNTADEYCHNSGQGCATGCVQSTQGYGATATGCSGASALASSAGLATLVAQRHHPISKGILLKLKRK